MNTRHFFIAVFAFANLLPTSGFSNDDWKSFQNGGALTSPKTLHNIPTQWDSKSGIRWTLDLKGYGQSSPVVDGDQVYLTTVTGDMKNNFQLLAIEKKTGKVRWTKDVANPTPEKSSSYVSRAAPTPACDANGVIAFYEGGLVVAYSRAGEPRWELNLVSEYGPIKARHGLSSSLEQNEDHVFAWVEREDKPYLLAIEKKSGKVVWKSEGLGATSWSSPRLVPVDSGHHLVLSGIGRIAGYDPQTGKKLWTFDQISGNSTPTPIPIGEGRFLIGASTGRGEQTSGKAARSNGLIQIKQENGTYSASFAWQAEQATSTFGSPLAHNGHAYFVNQSGVLFCLDLKTGKQLYAGRVKSSIWATPIGVGENVYLFGKDGTTTVVGAGSTFEKKFTNPLWTSSATPAQGPGGFGGPVLYSGVMSDDCLLLRRGDKLFCVGKSEQ